MILDVGAGAAGGLETLLERMRADELLRQRAGAQAEDVRHNRADEALRSRQLDESTASRRDTIARQILNDMQGDAEKRQSGYGVGATMGPKGVTFNEQEVPRAEAQKNMDVLGSSTLYHAPNVQGTSTMGVIPLIGAQGPTAQKSAPSTLTEPTPTLLFKGTGAQRLGAQKQAETEYKSGLAADEQQKRDAAQEARDAEIARHNQATENKQNDPLVKVEHQDENGRAVIEWLPRSQLQGQTFKKPTSGATETRLASAQAVTQVGENIIAKLSDPSVAAAVGPLMGRASKLRDFIGNPPPEFANLAGEIESYALANMGVHGMRSAQGAAAISKLLDGHHTPESLIETIRGLNTFSKNFMANEGRGGASATQDVGPQQQKPKLSAAELRKKYGG